MADNIKIVGEILSTQEISRYDVTDTRLLTSQKIQKDFGHTGDYIEYFIYDAVGNLLNLNYNYKDFKSPSTSFVTPSGSLPIIEIDPVMDLQNLGYSSGEFKTQYNFFTNKLSNPSAQLFLKEISSDRTEIRVGSTILTNEQIESESIELINQYTGSAYFTEYIVNFGKNTQALAVNIALNKAEPGYEILFKLYQPLDLNIQEKSSLWIVEEKTNPFSFDINLDKLITLPSGPKLRGPNFGIEIADQNNVATSYQTYEGLVSSVQSVSTSSYQQLLSLVTSQSIDINVDYTSYNNFIFFSSAEQRVKKFYTKIKQIEDYKNSINKYTISSSLFPSMLSDINTATASINDIISNFDGYEYYLYFDSSSYTWPKTNSSLPYTLASTSSALTWYNATTSSANLYDGDNQNYIVNTLPAFVKDDDNNSQYITFLNMIGHYFDNIWIFLSAVTDTNLSNNNLDKGVSKDLVYHVLQSLGIKLYNQYGDSSNIDFLIGNSGSANWDNNFTSTGSYLNTIPHKDLLAESYKRIYHNLPLLLKTKGTNYGLQTLISTFGITGSILPIKEYGGSLKTNNIFEQNSDKVRIISNSIVTGSVLSPYISLQQQPTSSTLFRTNDLHYVDVSFSPQDKIDQFTSASIAVSNPTWNLDNYIGDPRQQYSSSYADLLVEKQTYYSPLTASIIPFTGSAGSGSIGATDYNSFIRLIQFFDNSLFKMIKDYVPARANLSTGVTINSPILERNKFVVANPNATSKINATTGSISGSTIGSEYTDLYDGLTGTKLPYYDGNFTGSGINVYNYFVSGNFNPYLLPGYSNSDYESYTYEYYISGGYWFSQYVPSSFDSNDFVHSDFNILFNNISQSRVSGNKRDIEYIFGTNNQYITFPAQLQDSYDSLRTHQLSRYEGSKIYSLLYNNYTSASANYDGDVSFGKTAVIDRNSTKLGLFSEVTLNKFLPKRNNAVLKYLVDIDGNLTELNLRNRHWPEIQNTFVAGHTGSVSLFNNQLYSNQKTTDGEKIIFDSGYSYNPILYFGPTGSDSILYFQNVNQAVSYKVVANNSLSPNAFISGSTSPAYPLNSGYVYNIFDTETIDSNNVFTPGSSNHFPTYSVAETGNYIINASLPFTYEQPTNPINDATWSLQVYRKDVGGTEHLISQDTQYFKAGDPPTATLTFLDYQAGYFGFDLDNPIPSTDIVIVAAGVDGYVAGTCIGGSEDSDYLTPGSSLTIPAGSTFGAALGSNGYGLSTGITRYKKNVTVDIQGVGTKMNGNTFMIGSTLVTLSIPDLGVCLYYAN
jgi:hypothetical protein